jgi:hypothetical protein
VALPKKLEVEELTCKADVAPILRGAYADVAPILRGVCADVAPI